MSFDEFQAQRRFWEAWQSVRIVRDVDSGLFTFGESFLPYYLLCDQTQPKRPVVVTRGVVRVERPMIITPDNGPPDLQNFFSDEDEHQEGIARFLLARSAHFSRVKLDNRRGMRRLAHEGMDAVVERISRELDEQQEDRVAILAAPEPFGGIAVLRYAAERVWRSSPENIQELRERGFLP